jgi:hypothetical protein
MLGIGTADLVCNTYALFKVALGEYTIVVRCGDLLEDATRVIMEPNKTCFLSIGGFGHLRFRRESEASGPKLISGAREVVMLETSPKALRMADPKQLAALARSGDNESLRCAAAARLADVETLKELGKLTNSLGMTARLRLAIVETSMFSPYGGVLIEIRPAGLRIVCRCAPNPPGANHPEFVPIDHTGGSRMDMLMDVVLDTALCKAYRPRLLRFLPESSPTVLRGSERRRVETFLTDIATKSQCSELRSAALRRLERVKASSH